MKPPGDPKEWASLEDAWLEALSADPIDVPPLLELAEEASRHDRKRAVELLGLLAGELIDRAAFPEARLTLRLAVRLAPGNPELRRMVIQLLRERAPDRRAVERMIAFARLTEDPLQEAWDRFEALQRLRVGSYVSHDSRGPGKIVEWDTASEDLTVDFTTRRGHRMSWAMALKVLTPLAPDHLLAMTVDRAEELVSMAPVDLLVLAVRSLGGDAEPKDIRRLVEPIVGQERWASWWAEARRLAKADPRLHVGLAKPMRFVVVTPERGGQPSPLEELEAAPASELARLALTLAKDERLRPQVREVVRRRAGGLRKDVPSLLQALLVAATLGDEEASTQAVQLLTETEDPVGLVLSLRIADLRRQAMALLQGIRDPASVRKALFLRSSNASDWEALVRRMTPEEQKDVVRDVVRELPSRAATYFWLVRKADEGFPLPGSTFDRVCRLVELLDDAPGLVGPVTTYVAERRIFQRVLEESPDKARSVLSFLETARLPVSLKDEIRAEVYARFPTLRPTADLIFTTPEGLRRREEELRHLIKVEVPQNKAALEEAKAHGDLRENFEYKAAKEQQERISARINELQRELSKARVLSPEMVDTSTVGPGCRVTMSAPDGKTQQIVLLGPWDSDPDAGVFSYLAPGVAPLLGTRVGETVRLEVPGVAGEFRIVAIEPWR